LSGGAEILGSFACKLLFYAAITVLILPKNGYLNIRRIAIVGTIFTLTGTSTFLLIGAIAVMTSYDQIPYIVRTIIALQAAVIFTLVLCGRKKVRPMIAEDEYVYATKEKLLKAVGWNISEAEILNRRKYLDDASRRDFPKEYVGRFYGKTDSLVEIESIQQRLNNIQNALDGMGDNGDKGNDGMEIEKLEQEGADLLGKLSIVYKFDTGINNCPIEIL